MALPGLRIRLLGDLELRRDGDSLPPPDSARAASLLAYLLLHRDAPQSRQRLAFLLWPDSTEAQARTNLRHLLHLLRRALPDPDHLLDVTPRTLQWRTGTPVWLDVAVFEQALANAEREEGDRALAALRDAIDLYRGDLLLGCDDEWLLDERERLRQRYLDALGQIAGFLEARGDAAEAIPYAERLLRHEPLREETYRLLMRLHDARGDRARALRVYHTCVATLERELGVGPSAPTREAYEALLPEREQSSGAHAVGRVGGPPLVGRARERARLADLWRATERGRAQFVLVSGEPGVGKTRLLEDLRVWCAQRGAVVAEARCYAAEGGLAYGPVVTWLRAPPVRMRLVRLDHPRLTELARLLPELVVEVPGLAPPEPLPERDQRHRLADATVRALLTPDAPLLLVVDDIHWCDPETLHLLHYLLRVAPDGRLMVAATARREDLDERHPLNDLLTGLHALERVAEVPLERLARAEIAVLAEHVAGRPLAPPDVDRLYTETEGNPLFVVEALRAGWEHGLPSSRAISPRVQAIIESRLAQLSETARDLAGVAATIGREFTAEVLATASQMDDDTLVRGLDELWRRRIVREQGAEGYDFSHDKIREVAYRRLSPARRRYYHVRVAEALVRLHAGDPSPVSGQVAVHYDRAGLAEPAVTWYPRAAEAAQRLHATAETVRLLDRALTLLATLPRTPQRDVRELGILTALATPLGTVEGYSSERLSSIQQRALALAKSLATPPPGPVLRSLAIANLARGDFASAQRTGEQLRAQADREADDGALVEAAYVLGIAAFWQGEFVAARAHFETAVARYRPEHRGVHLLRYGLDPQVVCLSRLGNTLWFLGCPAAAVRACDDALALADEVGHPSSRGTAQVFAALLAVELRDQARLRESVTALVAGHKADEMRPNQIVTPALAAYVDVLDGRASAGIACIQHALAEAGGADHAPGMRAGVLRVLLEACAVAGDAKTGLAAAESALVLGGAARIWASETHRRRAEFLATLGVAPDEVEAELVRAVRVARRQGAAMLELRAAAGLLRHRLARGDVAGARATRAHLASIVDRVTEGRHTPDLRDAVALLADS